MQTAVLLMAIGMGTVFLILLLVINFSKLLIRAINRWAPEEDSSAKKVAAAAAPVAAIPANVEAAIKEAIKKVAPGAMVTNIKKG